MNNKAIEMQQVLKKRITLNILLLVIFSLLFVLQLYLTMNETTIFNLSKVISNEDSYDFVRGYQFGISLGLFIGSVIKLVINLLTINNENKLTNKYIKEHDERNLYIASKIGYLPMRIILIILLIISIIAPYFDIGIYKGVLISIYIIAIVEFGLYFYYQKKY